MSNISFEPSLKIDSSKLKDKIHDISQELKSDHRHLENKIQKLVKGDDGSTIMGESMAYGTSAVIFFACALFFPVSPLVAFALFGVGGVWGFQAVNNAYTLSLTIPKIQQKMQKNQELQRELDSDDFTSLCELESRSDFFKRIFKKIEEDELTKTDIKALLCIHKAIKRDTKEADSLVEDLQKEWDEKRKIVNWSQKIQA